MTPFLRARHAALALRKKLFQSNWMAAIPSGNLLSAAEAEDGEDLIIEDVNASNLSLGGADAILLRDLRQILVRNDVSIDERAFLVSHEIGHWILHLEGHEGCHKIIDGTLIPEKSESFGAQKVEAYGARERAELQANTFAREFLLPRDTAKELFSQGHRASSISNDLNIPLEIVRQQLLDSLLLPMGELSNEESEEAITPTLEQITASESTSKTSLVVAGPGTGKTTTLLLRVKHLLAQGTKAHEILIMTFSNRAARELVDRLQNLGIEDAHDIWVGTFHTFGLEFLRKNHEHFGLKPGFGIADKLAQIAILEEHINDVELKAFSPLGDPLDWLDIVVTTIQRAKDEIASPIEFANAVELESKITDEEMLAKRRDIATLYVRYESEKQKKGRLADLGDLVMLPAIALRNNPRKFSATTSRFKHILVDEYQDVNRASAELIKALSIEVESLWVVGDPRQAIYRFRGASMHNVIEFGQDFPDYKKFELSQNRRSFEEIVHVFEHSGTASHPLQRLLPLAKVQAVKGRSGVRPVHIVCQGDGDQIDSTTVAHNELVKHTQKLLSQGVQLKKQAILASTHHICGTAAEALINAGIPALHLGDIFQRSEVKNLLSILQVMIDRSASALVRLSQLSDLSIPRDDIKIILAWLRTSRPQPLTWFNQPPVGLSPAATQALKHWSYIFHNLKSTDSPWNVICEILLERTKILIPYLSGNTIIDITRRLALWQFIYFLRVPDGAQPYQTVGSFITRLRRRLRVNDDRELRTPPPEADCLDAVAVMTIHQSKGLEFEAVHFVDVDARHFRGEAELSFVPISLMKSISREVGFEERAEASNKLYVALSRARKHLILYEQKAWNGECAPAVSAAAHFLDRQEGVKPVNQIKPSLYKTLSAATVNSNPITTMENFVQYVVCARRYYYEYELELTPSSGLPNSVLVERAVFEDLFTSEYTTPNAYNPSALETLFITLTEMEPKAIKSLKAYSQKLLMNGRKLLGVEKAVRPGYVDVLCNGVTLRIRPHQILEAGSTYTFRFFRMHKYSKGTRHEKVLRWVLQELSKAHPEKIIKFEVCILNSGITHSIQAYKRTPDILINKASQFLSQNFEPQSGAWDCAKCRHFTYCPA